MSFLSFVIIYSFTRTARPFTKFSPPFLYLPSLWETIIANLKGHKFSFLFSPYKNQRNEGPKMKTLFWSCTLWAFDPITKSKLNCWVKTQIKILNEVRMTKIWLTIFLFFFCQATYFGYSYFFVSPEYLEFTTVAFIFFHFVE